MPFTRDIATGRRVGLWLIAGLVLLIAAHFADAWTFQHVSDPRIYERDWGRLLRVMGFVPLWCVVALAIALASDDDRAEARKDRLRNAMFLLLAVLTTGIVGEVVKLVIRRERPAAHNGEHFYRAWTDRPLSTSGLAMPSSHAIIAFGAAFALARLYPRTASIWFVLAAGCAYTRVAARAHFLSDVVLSVLVAGVTVHLVARWARARFEAKPAV